MKARPSAQTRELFELCRQWMGTAQRGSHRVDLRTTWAYDESCFRFGTAMGRLLNIKNCALKWPKTDLQWKTGRQGNTNPRSRHESFHTYSRTVTINPIPKGSYPRCPYESKKIFRP
jgi:hypothetical protein